MDCSRGQNIQIGTDETIQSKNGEHPSPSQTDQNLMRSDAKFSYEMSVNGQTLHKDYLDAHIQQGNEGQTVISSGTKLLYELKPDCEAESGPLNNIDNTQEFSPLKCKEAYPSGTKTQQVETSIRSIFGNGISGEAHDNHYAQINSSKEAIDFIGSFLTHPICTLKNSTINCTGKFDLSPQLDLSLRRSRPISFENELTEERHTLMHSNASAFKCISDEESDIRESEKEDYKKYIINSKLVNTRSRMQM
ncbi:hypothetical protein JHK85_043738 [Glycine max]|nr:hypothetical protein JHK85_043738 [Glycine max]